MSPPEIGRRKVDVWEYKQKRRTLGPEEWTPVVIEGVLIFNFNPVRPWCNHFRDETRVLSTVVHLILLSHEIFTFTSKTS